MPPPTIISSTCKQKMNEGERRRPAGVSLPVREKVDYSHDPPTPACTYGLITSSYLIEHVVDQLDLVTDFRPADDAQERPARRAQRRLEVVQLLFHQKAAGALFQGNSDAAAVRAVSRTKRIVDIYVAELGQPGPKGRYSIGGCFDLVSDPPIIDRPGNTKSRTEARGQRR